MAQLALTGPYVATSVDRNFRIAGMMHGGELTAIAIATPNDIADTYPADLQPLTLADGSPSLYLPMIVSFN